MIWNETTEWPVSIMRIQFELTKPTAMTVIKPQICPTFSSTTIDKNNNINDKTDNVKMIFPPIRIKTCSTVKNGNASFLLFGTNVHTSLHSPTRIQDHPFYRLSIELNLFYSE